MKRRDFLKTTALSAAGVAGEGFWLRDATATPGDTAPSSNPATLPRREYGHTGIQVSVIGLGGILLAGMEQPRANRIVAEAVERGLNYFDVAPTYGDAELKLGPALAPYRKQAFLACKTAERRREGASGELKRSLERLQTDHFDLYQLHGIKDIRKDIDTAFAKGGAMEALVEARKSGQVRFLGFSAHTVEAARAAMERFEFDSVLFPVNFAMYYKSGFGPQIIDLAKAKGVTRLAIKAMARQAWPKDDPDRKKYRNCWYQPLTDRREAELALRFTLSQPVTAAIPPGDASLLKMAIDLAVRFKPLTADEDKELRALAMYLNPVFPLT